MAPAGKALIILPKVSVNSSTKLKNVRVSTKNDAQPQNITKLNKWWANSSAYEDRLLVGPDVPWYNQIKVLGERDDGELQRMRRTSVNAQAKVMETLATIYAKQAALFMKTMVEIDTSSDQKWLNSVIQSGTHSDKVHY